MSDWAQRPVTPPFISSLSRWMGGYDVRAAGSALGSSDQGWSTANLAHYIPFWLPWPYTVQRVFVANGSAAGGNWGVGVLNESGVSLYSSAATAASGNSSLQFFTPSAPLLLMPGRYWLGVTHSATTANQAFGTDTFVTQRLKLAGFLQQASQTTIPSTATFAASSATKFFVCGITRTAS